MWYLVFIITALGYGLEKVRNFLDPKQEKSRIEVLISFFTLMYVLLKYKYLKSSDHLEHLGKNKKYLKVPYVYGDRDFCYLLKVPRGVIPFRSIVDENGTDITTVLFPYLGPCLNFHGGSFCPKDFGYEKITFTNVNDIETIFKEEEFMKFK